MQLVTTLSESDILSKKKGGFLKLGEEEEREEEEKEEGEDLLPVQRGGFLSWRKLGSH